MPSSLPSKNPGHCRRHSHLAWVFYYNRFCKVCCPTENRGSMPRPVCPVFPRLLLAYLLTAARFHTGIGYTERHGRQDTPEEGVVVCADVWTRISRLWLNQRVWHFIRQYVSLQTMRLLPNSLPGSVNTACCRRRRFEPLQI